jgi:hypothetical protein
MGLLKPAQNGTVYLKLGQLGFEGSGKTYLAVEFAVGLTKLAKGSKVAFFDTEKGSDFHIKRFKSEGIQLDVLKSRSFKDLCDTIREAEANGYSFLIIDSITHVWRDLVDSWLRKKGRTFLTMKDWGVLKAEWAQYTDLYVNSKLSIAMLGRAGHEYDQDEDEDGNTEIKKAGTKMKVETETGFEPDLLIECFKSPKITVSTVKGKKRQKRERGFVNKCVILKDRNDVMNGMEIEMPKFKDFMPIIKMLNVGGEHLGVDTTRTSDGIFDNPKISWAERDRQKEILIAQIKELLVLNDFDGSSAETKKKRTQLLVDCFGTSTEPGIGGLTLENLQMGIATMKMRFMNVTADDLEFDAKPVVKNGAADRTTNEP